MVLKMKMSLRHILVSYTYPLQYLGCQEAFALDIFFELTYFCLKERGKWCFYEFVFHNCDIRIICVNPFLYLCSPKFGPT